MSCASTIVAILVGSAVYLVVAQALVQCSPFRFPRLIAALVTLLGCLGVMNGFRDSGVWAGILIPYEALIMTVLMVLLVLGVSVSIRRAKRMVKWLEMKVDGKDTDDKGNKDKKAPRHACLKSGGACHSPWRSNHEETDAS